MQLTNRVSVLAIEGKNDPIHPTLIKGSMGYFLIDTGFPGQFDALCSAIEADGLRIEDVASVILTHQDLDHIGNVAEIRAAVPQVMVCAHRAEVPYLSGDKVPVKVAAMEARLDEMSDDKKAMYRSFSQGFADRRMKVDAELTDKSVVDAVIGLRVIPTPGHTPGHISLYLEEEGVLVVGDAMVVRDGELQGPDPRHTQDMHQALVSLQQFSPLDVNYVVCYHGGMYTGNFSSRLAEILG